MAAKRTRFIVIDKMLIAASVISGISAITTVLRASGRAGEYAGHIKEELPMTRESIPCRRLRLHLTVTVIWYSISLLLALPVVLTAGKTLFWLSPFIVLACVLWAIWHYSVLKNRASRTLQDRSQTIAVAQRPEPEDKNRADCKKSHNR